MARSSRATSAPEQSAAPASTVEHEREPRQITVRTIVLFAVILVAFVVLAPTMRAYLNQQEDLRDLNSRIEAAEQRNAELEAAIARWSDDAYVQAQARERLGFVFPGETPYRVVDPHTVTGEDPEDEDAESGPVLVPSAGPWYLTVWDSVQVAGEVGE